jgi:hypothetical protein
LSLRFISHPQAYPRNPESGMEGSVQMWEERSEYTYDEEEISKPDGSMHVPLEIALLVASAISRDVQLSTWFSEESSGGVMSAKEFKSRLVSLTTALSIGQSAEISMQLRSAVGKDVLRALCQACSCESGSTGTEGSDAEAVDVSYFLRDSQQVVEDYVNNLKAPGGTLGTEETGGDLYTEGAEEEGGDGWGGRGARGGMLGTQERRDRHSRDSRDSRDPHPQLQVP